MIYMLLEMRCKNETHLYSFIKTKLPLWANVVLLTQQTK